MSNDRYTDEELNARLQDPIVRGEALELGFKIILTLLAGPAEWRNMAPLAVDPAKAREAARVVRNDPSRFADKSWIDSQKAVADAVMAGLWREFEAWCQQNERHDLLVNSLDLINAALPADEQIKL